MREKLSIVYKSSAPPFPTALMATCFTVPLKDSVGLNDFYTRIYCFLQNKNSSWYFPEEEMAVIGKKVAERLMENRFIAEHVEKKFLEQTDKVLNLIERKKLLNIEKLSGKKILEIFKKATRFYPIATYFAETPQFNLEIRGNDAIKEKFYEFLKAKNPRIKESEKAELFSTLITPTNLSFVAEAELSLLKISQMEKEKGEKAIEEHAERFYWQLYDYYDPIIDKESIEKELENYKKVSPKEIKERIKKLENSEKESEKKLEQITKELSLPKGLANGFRNIRRIVHLYNDIKKERISKANVGFGIILKEISKRTGIPEKEMHYTTVEEIEDLLEGKKIGKKILEERVKKSCIICEAGRYHFLTEKELEEFESKTLSKGSEKVKIIKGMPACSGFFTGTARVITNKTQIPQLKQGEILVTTMTSVDYVPAMKKAGAIVTDLGGITCHAAIVSRELGIPCVIATGNATELIKTGDIIEVNAKHGIIKIIK